MKTEKAGCKSSTGGGASCKGWAGMSRRGLNSDEKRAVGAGHKVASCQELGVPHNRTQPPGGN
eukprot:4800870-Alexandrium_andersonii.AAC.1